MDTSESVRDNYCQVDADICVLFRRVLESGQEHAEFEIGFASFLAGPGHDDRWLKDVIDHGTHVHIAWPIGVDVVQSAKKMKKKLKSAEFGSVKVRIYKCRAWTKLTEAIKYWEEYGCLSPTRRERAELKRKRDRESFTSGEDLDNSDGTRGDRGEVEDEEYQPLSKKSKIIPQKANLTAYELELAAEILDRENNEDLNIAQPQSDQAIPASTPAYLSPRRSRSRSRSRSPSRSISRSTSRSPRRLTERSPSRSRPQSPSRSISQPAPRSPQSSPSRSRSRSPTQSPRSTSPQALSESSNFGDIEELRTRVGQLTKELERKDTKLAKLERKLQETLATLENAKSQLLARQSVQVSHSVSPLAVRRIPVLPQGVVMNKKRGETYPLPTEGYKLPSYCITNNTKLDPESFAAWILPLVFTAEELRSCSLYGIQIKTNNCLVKPALPEHRFNACLNENFRLFGDLPRFEARFGQGGRNVLPKNRVKK
ncbi:hypothetical protein QAD02_002267 [Eretmocerus hayati]|uniref:Uncharacterized protein n=1 Tax=Eretmocerus hayati TaxID=131215 RepID=A0ACC2NJC4_9HYME|nr:hypothetical protein QAD02_002267 [Eretmocerus hayati]